MELATIENMSKEELLISFFKYNRTNNEIYDYILLFPGFDEDFLATKDIYQTMKNLKIKFTKNEVNNMPNSLLMYISNSLKKDRVIEILKKDGLFQK